MGKALTHKQGSLLFKLTLRKFWEHPTPPTIREASDLITLCLEAVKARARKDTDFAATVLAQAVRTIRRWYPDFEPDDLQPRFGNGHGRKRASKPKQTAPKPARKRAKADPKPATPDPEPADPTPTEADTPNPDAQQDPEPTPDPEPDPADEPTPAPDGNGKPGNLQDRIAAFIRAGLKQLLIVGPAGCGKTTCATLAAEASHLDCTLIPCNLGTPAYTFTGRRHPISGEFEPTEFTKAYQGNDKGSIIILDEVDKLDPSTAAAVNASLANGHLATPDGPIPRHPDTVVLGTANTWGHGADRQYCGSNQLDAATLDRFAGGRLQADYDPDYESQYDPAVVAYCRRVREHINARHLRRVCSTRLVQACTLLKAAGLDWRQQVTADWTDSQREGL